MLTVGNDTYISLQDAATYISQCYTATSKEVVLWESLSQDNKEIYLRRACSKIDRQRLTGRKADKTQQLMFPRKLFSCSVHKYVKQTSVPDAIRHAQVEEALELASNRSNTRIELRQQGVKTITTGKASETYIDSVNITEPLLSLVAKQMLLPYLAKAVPIC